MGKLIITVLLTGAVVAGVFVVLFFAGKNGDTLGPPLPGSIRAGDEKPGKADSELKFTGEGAANLAEINARLKNHDSELAKLKDENTKLKKEIAELKKGSLASASDLGPDAPPLPLDGGKAAELPSGGNSLLAAFPSAKEDIKEIIKDIRQEDHQDRNRMMRERMTEEIPKMAQKLAEKFEWDTATQNQVADILLDRHTRVQEILQGRNPRELSEEERRDLHQQVGEIMKDTNDRLQALVGEETFKELMPILNPGQQQGGRQPGMQPGQGGRRPGGMQPRPGGNK
ncbi:MAG: hypothetical protein ACYS8W_12810 [Planctomycetota bacterium]|jgi:hypothetical protein